MVAARGEGFEQGRGEVVGVAQVLEGEGRAVGQLRLAGQARPQRLGRGGALGRFLRRAGPAQGEGAQRRLQRGRRAVALELRRAPLGPDLLADHLRAEQLAELEQRGRRPVEGRGVEHPVRPLGLAREEQQLGKQPARRRVARGRLHHRLLGGDRRPQVARRQGLARRRHRPVPSHPGHAAAAPPPEPPGPKPGAASWVTRRNDAPTSSSWWCGCRCITQPYSPGRPGRSRTSTRASRSG